MTMTFPFFSSQVWPEAELKFSPMHSESHVPGRHLNALLNAEDAVGVYFDEGCVERHARAAFLSYSGELPLPLNPRSHWRSALALFAPQYT